MCKNITHDLPASSIRDPDEFPKWTSLFRPKKMATKMGPLTRSRLEELGVCGGFKYFRIGEMIQFALCIFLRWVGEKPPTRLYMFFFVVGFHTLGIIPYMLFAFLVR